MITPNHPMKASLSFTKTAWLLLWGGAPLAILPVVHAADGAMTAVSSIVSDAYFRHKLPNGTFEPETYAFGEGGLWRGPMRDGSIDLLNFKDVARTIAGPLADQYYLPAKDPNQTKLLILVYWGTTHGSFEHYTHWDELEGSAFDLIDARTAPLLGFDSELAANQGLEFTALRYRRQELLDEIEHNRYFVVLMAYDFQLLWKQKKHKLLWETRFSVGEHRNDFGQQLAGMAQDASQYFGQDTHGLLRKPVPRGHVTLGDLKVIEVVPEK